MILVVRHIPYLLVPTNFTGPWYYDKVLQVIKEVKGLLVREKRVVDIITRIVAIITAITAMVTASVALSQTYKMPTMLTHSPRMSFMPFNKCL
jgi:hypothetical protein